MDHVLDFGLFGRKNYENLIGLKRPFPKEPLKRPPNPFKNPELEVFKSLLENGFKKLEGFFKKKV